jgi:hypothetical protein
MTTSRTPSKFLPNIGIYQTDRTKRVNEPVVHQFNTPTRKDSVQRNLEFEKHANPFPYQSDGKQKEFYNDGGVYNLNSRLEMYEKRSFFESKCYVNFFIKNFYKFFFIIGEFLFLIFLLEFGINSSKIKQKLCYVFSYEAQYQSSQKFIQDLDVFIPIIIALVFLTNLWLSSNTPYIIISYCIHLIFSTSAIWEILNFFATKNKSISLYKVYTVLLYCLLPTALFSFFSILFGLRSLPGIIFSIAVVIYCTYIASSVIINELMLRDKSFAVYYMLGVYYAIYVLFLN